VLQLRAFASPERVAAAGEQLHVLDGVRHVLIGRNTVDGAAMLTGDVEPESADGVLDVLRESGFASEDVTLWRATSIQPLTMHHRVDAGQDAAVWAEIASRAMSHSRLASTYLLYMVTAGVVAAVGVVTDSSILIVGAMALSPDLLPISASAVGIVERRWRLARRAIFTLITGLTVAALSAAASTLLLRVTGRIDAHLDLTDNVLGPTFTELGPGSVLVAVAAGVAGMLAYETAGSAAVGVAISVTTIPAAAYVGVDLGLAGSEGGFGALKVLITNVVLIQAACVVTLWIQRRLAAQHSAV
jgi:uncharacterized hydrophobic protein (TIGR00271 family)